VKVLVTGRLPDEVVALIEKDHHVEINNQDRPMDRENLLSRVGDKEGLLCMITDRVDTELLNCAPHLKIIANFGVGFNNIDINAATERGIPVTNTPGVLTDSTADLAFALILASGRRLVEGDRNTRAGEFTFWAPLHFLGQEITGKTLGIIGLGRIGKAVAKRAAGFDMKVIYYNRQRLETGEEKALNVVFASFKTLLEESDFVSLHVPLTPQTTHLIGQKELNLMKPSAYLINTSRGPVVDEKSLLEALKNQVICGAGLDVYESEPELTPGLSDLDNVVLLPHIGSATIETRTRMAQMAAENLLAGLSDEIPPNCLNCSELSGNRCSD
jgi:glyoxylate reductase